MDDLKKMEERYHPSSSSNHNSDWRSEFTKDKGKIIHSAGFRRLQGKTQVMGAGEGDFHRTRLTHSLEVAQIGTGIFEGFKKKQLGNIPDVLLPYLKGADPIIASACYAHDLGHPPFGHGGEIALHKKMQADGGFEGNAQTLRILTNLEKYYRHQGINPTRRTILSILKYPVVFSSYSQTAQSNEKPPKCYYNLEENIIKWVLDVFTKDDALKFTELSTDEKPKHKAFDTSIMDSADDIAFCTHDLEDVIARKIISKEEFLDKFNTEFRATDEITCDEHVFKKQDFEDMFKDAFHRKKNIGKLVNMLITTCNLNERQEFEHPLLRFHFTTNPQLENLIEFLKTDITYKMVVSRPHVCMLEKKGQKIISDLFDCYSSAPEKLIPHWYEMDPTNTKERKICDYIAGMTDSYAEKIFHRMFTAGYGSSMDEL